MAVTSSRDIPGWTLSICPSSTRGGRTSILTVGTFTALTGVTEAPEAASTAGEEAMGMAAADKRRKCLVADMGVSFVDGLRGPSIVASCRPRRIAPWKEGRMRRWGEATGRLAGDARARRGSHDATHGLRFA